MVGENAAVGIDDEPRAGAATRLIPARLRTIAIVVLIR
jgi:hypothetical protein